MQIYDLCHMTVGALLFLAFSLTSARPWSTLKFQFLCILWAQKEFLSPPQPVAPKPEIHTMLINWIGMAMTDDVLWCYDGHNVFAIYKHACSMIFQWNSPALVPAILPGHLVFTVAHYLSCVCLAVFGQNRITWDFACAWKKWRERESTSNRKASRSMPRQARVRACGSCAPNQVTVLECFGLVVVPPADVCQLSGSTNCRERFGHRNTSGMPQTNLLQYWDGVLMSWT